MEYFDKYLFAAAAKLQAYIGGELRWQDVSGANRSPQALFGHVRRVRNNHGEFNGIWLEPERSRQPIARSFRLLETLRTLDPDLGQAISGNLG